MPQSINDSTRNREYVRSVMRQMDMLAEELQEYSEILPENERSRVRGACSNIRNSRYNLISWWKR